MGGKKEASATDFLIDFAAGGVSGAVSKTLTAPIERVKLVIQTQDANPRIKSGEVPRYTGIGNCFSRILKEQGMAAFWRGNGVNIIRYFPTQAFNLAFKDTIKAMFPKYNKNTEFWKFFGTQLASGGLAGAASLTIVYPLDYARTRLASDVGTGKRQFNGLMDCLMKTAKSDQGFFSLYNGFGPSVAGIIAYRGSQFGLNDTLLAFNPYAKDVSVIGIVSKFVVAQISVTVSGLCAYPFDTVRRRLQMESEKPMEQRMYKGTLDCGVKILRDEGFGGMYKGALANIFRGVGASLVLVLYGEIKNALARQRAEEQ
jgi:solute carrier family 25 (adenine nucleotide translocator) protein 4/5/6/31